MHKMKITFKPAAGQSSGIQHQKSSDGRSSRNQSLRSLLGEAQRLEPNTPARVTALERLKADADMRCASRQTLKRDQSASKLMQRAKRKMSKYLNKYLYGHYGHTAQIAQTYALEHLGINQSPTPQQGRPRESIPYENSSHSPNDCSTAYFSCHSTLLGTENNSSVAGREYSQNIVRIAKPIRLTSIEALKPLIHGALMAETGGTLQAKQAALEAFDYLLFAFNSNNDTRSPEPFELTWDPSALSLTLQTLTPRIGSIVASSRIPLDFALNNVITARLHCRETGSVTLEFTSPSFFSVRLTPEAAVNLCNSYNIAARSAGAVAKTMAGLERSASSQIHALTFTPQNTVQLREDILFSDDWPEDFKRTTLGQLKSLFEQSIPHAKQAEYLAGSAWTIACLKASAGTLNASMTHNENTNRNTLLHGETICPTTKPIAKYPQAKTSNVLKILRPVALASAEKPGRIQWQHLTDSPTIETHLKQLDQTWANKGAPGQVLKFRGAKVYLTN
jgi:hypothetical protein